MNNILEIQNIQKDYITEKEKIEAIKNISFSLKQGEIISLVGTSGCGKSSLLNILAGLENATNGIITFSKKNMNIGYMFQNDCLFPWLTIEENAMIGLKIQNQLTKENINYVNQLLKTYHLTAFKKKYPHELSGGMKQRVALIRTLALKPDILLLDEPFSALDYQTRLAISDDVYQIIKKENIAVIMVTHDIAEAISMSDKIIVLSKRPCTIKNIYKIQLSNKTTPFENRKAKEFSDYYNLIWKDLDINV